MRFATIEHAVAFGQLASEYQSARTSLPGARAADVLAAVRAMAEGAGNIEQSHCLVTLGHRWFGSGEDYDRTYCCYCGADGDA